MYIHMFVLCVCVCAYVIIVSPQAACVPTRDLTIFEIYDHLGFEWNFSLIYLAYFNTHTHTHNSCSHNAFALTNI